MDREDNQGQENLYDTEGLRYGVKENGRLSPFAYHQDEQLRTVLVSDRVSKAREHYLYSAYLYLSEVKV